MDLVIITHGHPDHVEGIKAFKGTHTLIAINTIEMNFIRKAGAQYGNALGIPDFEPDILLQEGDLKIGDLLLRVIHTPGHSPGSICLYWAKERVLFTGDVVFDEGVGRTDLPGAKGQELKESITEISRLQVDYLLPGHGEIVSGSRNVQTNFKEIKEYWFAYI
jgi:glyoxylase-like metal-dependent hydrolase (beta-lactamase superfamily II)